MSGALLSDSGIDTVRFRWRESNEEYQEFSRRPEGVVEGYRGERFVQTKLGRVGVYRDGLAYWEGRASAILADDPGDHNLLVPDDLHLAELAARDFVVASGVPLIAEPRLGRVDLASELRFQSSAEGSAFLHSLAGLDVPFAKARVDGLKGSHIESVSFHGTSGKTIHLRAYDKGVESGSDPAGRRIRVERQKRFRKSVEPTSQDFVFSDLKRAFWGREFKKLTTLDTAVVANLPDSLLALYERADSWSQAARLGGFLVFGRLLEEEMSRAAVYRFRSELRSLGIFVNDAVVERLEVPVGKYLQTLGAAWAA